MQKSNIKTSKNSAVPTKTNVAKLQHMLTGFGCFFIMF